MSEHNPTPDGDPRPDADRGDDGAADLGAGAGPEHAPFSHPDAPPYVAAQHGWESESHSESASPSPAWSATPGWAAYPPPPAAPARGVHPALIGVGSAVVAAALVLGGIALTQGTSTSGRGSLGEGLQQPTVPTLPQPNGGGVPPGGGGGGTGSTGSQKAATAAQQTGVVTIVSTLKYQNAQSAGTGMVLASDGTVLTNNHVIEGATSIVVTVETTGKSYRASVVGTAPASDVAVIKLQGASGLPTAKLADDAHDVAVGDDVTGVGNAGGTGSLSQVSGEVTGLDKSITASDENGQDAEKLTGLIQVNARIISGDSGGPLYDDGGEVIGMNTAASASQGTNPVAYAIPVDDAVALAGRIRSGVETSAIHIGYPGFLGVSSQDAQGHGAAVAGLLAGGPAAAAGITEGSVITKVDGTAVTSAASLRAVLTRKDPGSKVTVGWTDASGRARSATLTLAVGPAD